jgi:hypothetical protein
MKPNRTSFRPTTATLGSLPSKGRLRAPAGVHTRQLTVLIRGLKEMTVCNVVERKFEKLTVVKAPLATEPTLQKSP